MTDKPLLSVPFETRDMFNFAKGVAFSLRVRTVSAATTSLQLRGFTRNGQFTFVVPTLNDSSLQSATFRIDDIPIFFSVSQDANSLVFGQCFVIVELLANGLKVFTMASGYTGGFQSVDYPANNNRPLVPGHGYFRTRTSSNPAVGVEISASPPSGTIWRVHGMVFTLVTAATAGSRRVHVVVNDQNTYTLHMFSLVDQIISETKLYSVAHFGATPDETDNNSILINMPQEVWVLSGETIDTVTTNLAGGDNFSAMDLKVEEFPLTPA